MNCSTLKKITFFFTCVLPSALAAHSDKYPDTYPVTSSQAHRGQWDKSLEGYQSRWLKYGVAEHFQEWTYNQPDEVLKKEFLASFEKRIKLWYVEPDKLPLEPQADFDYHRYLISANISRLPFIAAFEYNAAENFYNASQLELSGLRFIALEAPRRDSVQAFFRTLLNQRITHLVRLTASKEQKAKRTLPYWEGRLDAQKTHFNIPLEKYQAYSDPDLNRHPVRYFFTEDWLDDQSLPIPELYRLVRSTHEALLPESIIAVHCTAGVSRTGTFIAALTLYHYIESQKKSGNTKKDWAISIEELIWRLSLQRVYPVAKFEQYLLLNRFLDYLYETS